jgi:hypothetical protein
MEMMDERQAQQTFEVGLTKMTGLAVRLGVADK